MSAAIHISPAYLLAQAVGGGELAHVRPLRLRLPVRKPPHLCLPPPVPGEGDRCQGNGCHGDDSDDGSRGVVLLLPTAGGQVLNAPPLAGEAANAVQPFSVDDNHEHAIIIIITYLSICRCRVSTCIYNCIYISYQNFILLSLCNHTYHA